MKQFIIILVLFLPITIQAGPCIDNYNTQQEENTEHYELQVDACSSDPDCIEDATNAHIATTVYNTLALIGCCGSFPVFC